ncbi:MULTISPECIES: AraC family transcriptional regulator [unclassified Enterococcus]|uniref:AraC family transcriptional regulator n=1 Tax=unclassified Enterococcus TaxID=2608891 RepID=UPI003D2CA14C
MEPRIQEIITYMEKFACEGLKVEKVAEHFGYSKFHFSREFKRITGISPNEYLSSLKIENGIESLVNGESVINSQLDAGYSSPGTFTTTFTKNTGLSPKTYAKQVNHLFELVKQQEAVDEDNDSLFYRNPNFPIIVSPYKLTVHIEVPKDFKGIVFSGLFLKPNPNHQPIMGRCRVKRFEYDFYHLPPGTYYPLACGVRRSKNPFRYFQLSKAMRACDGQSVTFPLEKNEELTIQLRERKISDPPLIINLPNILANGIKQQLARNRRKVKNRFLQKTAK